jgi:hypothetical protein
MNLTEEQVQMLKRVLDAAIFHQRASERLDKDLRDAIRNLEKAVEAHESS